MGGVIYRLTPAPSLAQGLSPRGRSHPTFGTQLPRGVGSISAWAESSNPLKLFCTFSEVYLRVGGVIDESDVTPAFRQGLSPRGRSHRLKIAAQAFAEGSISAWAESSLFARFPEYNEEVYLRVGGVIGKPSSSASASIGLSPRGRSHPRARSSPRSRQGSISAWAESSGFRGTDSLGRTVYLRVGGVIALRVAPGAIQQGLSPRGRSHRPLHCLSRHRGWSISAWAESSPGAPPRSRRPRVYLRVGGVIDTTLPAREGRWGLSPRGRSHHPVPLVVVGESGSISAWAESSVRSGRRPRGLRVYLRVGGVILKRSAFFSLALGLSPRGRSHRPRRSTAATTAGSISAWAESSKGTPSTLPSTRVYLRVGGVIWSRRSCFD